MPRAKTGGEAATAPQTADKPVRRTRKASPKASCKTSPTAGAGQVVATASGGRGDAALARSHTADALATLVAIMTNGDAPATARVSAANAVLDRAWGKPRQDFEFSASSDPVAAIQRARQRVHDRRTAAGALAAAATTGEEGADDKDG